jgi:hypothetical protein
MKALRIILIVAGIFLTVLFSAAILITWIRIYSKQVNELHDAPYLVGTVIGSLLFYIPPFLCFFFAKRIKRKLKRKQTEILFESLPQ